jgi:hypothetical protein
LALCHIFDIFTSGTTGCVRGSGFRVQAGKIRGSDCRFLSIFAEREMKPDDASNTNRKTQKMAIRFNYFSY